MERESRSELESGRKGDVGEEVAEVSISKVDRLPVITVCVHFVQP